MGTYFNGVNCDVYIGKGAGKMLLNEIQNAKRSIKIISPYLSPFLIKELINLQSRNLEIKLITTDDIEDFYGNYEKNISKLIIQNRKTDFEADNLRNKWIYISKILVHILWGLIVIQPLLVYFFMDIRALVGIIPTITIFLVYKLYIVKIKNKKIYNYFYSQLFPFKVYISPSQSKLSDTFIHGKIYLIDDAVAYLGSLNFTRSGMKNNYETRIKITDNQAINKIKEEINHLFYHSKLPQIDIQKWGRKLYNEPIN